MRASASPLHKAVAMRVSASPLPKAVAMSVSGSHPRHKA